MNTSLTEKGLLLNEINTCQGTLTEDQIITLKEPTIVKLGDCQNMSTGDQILKKLVHACFIVALKREPCAITLEIVKVSFHITSILQ